MATAQLEKNVQLLRLWGPQTLVNRGFQEGFGALNIMDCGIPFEVCEIDVKTKFQVLQVSPTLSPCRFSYFSKDVFKSLHDFMERGVAKTFLET